MGRDGRLAKVYDGTYGRLGGMVRAATGKRDSAGRFVGPDLAEIPAAQRAEPV